jgi:hypothetical protein
MMQQTGFIAKGKAQGVSKMGTKIGRCLDFTTHWQPSDPAIHRGVTNTLSEQGTFAAPRWRAQ